VVRRDRAAADGGSSRRDAERPGDLGAGVDAFGRDAVARAGNAQATMTERYVHAAQVASPGAADRAEERLYGAVTG
jgi:hypothetical protein